MSPTLRSPDLSNRVEYSMVRSPRSPLSAFTSPRHATRKVSPSRNTLPWQSFVASPKYRARPASIDSLSPRNDLWDSLDGGANMSPSHSVPFWMQQASGNSQDLPFAKGLRALNCVVELSPTPPPDVVSSRGAQEGLRNVLLSPQRASPKLAPGCLSIDATQDYSPLKRLCELDHTVVVSSLGSKCALTSPTSHCHGSVIPTSQCDGCSELQASTPSRDGCIHDNDNVNKSYATSKLDETSPVSKMGYSGISPTREGSLQVPVHSIGKIRHSLAAPVRSLSPNESSINSHSSITSGGPHWLDSPTKIATRNLDGYDYSPSRQIQHTRQQSSLKLAVFDFDCTLTSFHVYASLAGIAPTSCTLTVPPPYACTEIGQISRLHELDADPAWGPGVFALIAFGGDDRVSLLRSILTLLHSCDVECVVVSRGMVGTIKLCLEQLELLPFFERIVGNIGSALGVAEHDHDVAASTCSFGNWLGNPDDDIGGMTASKSEHIRRLMEERSLRFHQTVFLDDALEEIMEAQSTCRTIHVASGIGVKEHEFQLLQDMLYLSVPPPIM